MNNHVHGFVKFEIARRLLGHTNALVDISLLPQTATYGGEYGQNDTDIPEYIDYAAKVHAARKQRSAHARVRDWNRFNAQLPEVELVGRRLIWTHHPTPSNKLPECFLDSAFSISAITSSMKIDIAKGAPPLRADVPLEAALIVLGGFPPYAGSHVAVGGDPRMAASIDLSRVVSRDITDRLLAEYWQNNGHHFQKAS